MTHIGAEVLLALTLLTRLPVPARLLSAPPPLARAVWCFPLAGALVGALGGLLFAAMTGLGTPSALAASWTLAGLVLLTGGLHEDGLADVADGFGGGSDRERKLAIMRDSRIGTYGVLALGLSLAVRGLAIAALHAPGPVFAALVASGALGRGAILVVLLRLDPARSDGLAAALGARAAPACALGLGLSGAIALLALPPGAAVAASGAAGLGALAVAGLARRQIGGYTGDVLGAVAQVAECGALTALAVASA